MSALKLTITHWGTVALDKKGIKAVMRGAGNDVRSKTARLINATSGSGRAYAGGGGARYRGSYRPGAYRASAPGMPPVRVSGALRGSLKTYVFKTGEGFAVRERQFYSLFLEAGARGGGNFGSRSRGPAHGRRQRRRGGRPNSARVLLPRPHLDLVMAREKPNLDRKVKAALEGALTWKEAKKL